MTYVCDDCKHCGGYIRPIPDEVGRECVLCFARKRPIVRHPPIMAENTRREGSCFDYEERGGAV